MQFSTVRSLAGWAFQMSEAIPVKVQKFAEQIPGCVSELTPAEQKDMITLIEAFGSECGVRFSCDPRQCQPSNMKVGSNEF
jgi:hypothetical protein